jgi:hypothetical protein
MDDVGLVDVDERGWEFSFVDGVTAVVFARMFGFLAMLMRN